MKQAVLRQTLRVDANHQLHINVPVEMGDEIEVTVRPANQSGQKATISDDEQFLIAAYSAATPEDAKEKTQFGEDISMHETVKPRDLYVLTNCL